MLNQAPILTLVEKLTMKILNWKLVILLEYQNIKMFLQRVTLRIGLKKFSTLKNLKTLFRGHMLLVIVKVKKLLKRFTKKNCKKTNQKELEKVIKRKGNKLYAQWKGNKNSFDSWIDKKGHSLNE